MRKIVFIFIFLANAIYGQQTKIDTLNGSITKERAWWDIQHYDLTIIPDFQNKWIIGKNIIQYNLENVNQKN